MKDFFAAIGGVTSFMFIVGLIVFVANALGGWVSNLKYRHRIKHRFDKPPTAKCYCRDCTHHDQKNGRCYRFTEYRCTADNWFCWEAFPRNKNNNTEEKTDGTT